MQKVSENGRKKMYRSHGKSISVAHHCQKTKRNDENGQNRKMRKDIYDIQRRKTKKNTTKIKENYLKRYKFNKIINRMVIGKHGVCICYDYSVFYFLSAI